MGSLKLTLATTLLLASASSLAYAADLGGIVDPAGQAADPMIELGTGWYLRADAGASRLTMPKVSSDLNFLPSTRQSKSFSLGLGGGYKFNNWFRADASYDYRTPRSVSGKGGQVQCIASVDNTDPLNPLPVFFVPGCGVNQSIKLQRATAMANGYVDLGKWSGISPYVGAGVGLAILRTSGSVTYTKPDGTPYAVFVDPKNLAVTPLTPLVYDQSFVGNNPHRYNLAWSLMAGVGIDVAPHTTLDIGYRYLNLGKSQGLPAQNGKVFSKTIVEQEIRAGLRYMID